MPLLLHAIGPAEAQAAPLPETGLRPEWPLGAVCAAGLVAWASQCADVRPLGRGDALAHHRLAQQGLAAGLCLPVRFPTWVGDEQAVRELLDQRREALWAALDRVRGRVELAVTVTWLDTRPSPQPARLATTPGTRFLQERQRRYATTDQQRAEAQRLAGVIAADRRVLDAQHTIAPSQAIGLSSALLVAAEDALAVAKGLESLQEGVRILVNGPWPPYSFVLLEG